MILYTMIPHEMIFQENDDSFLKEETLEIDGGLLVVQMISEHEYKIVRLISSDPNLYLNPRYAPGQIVSASFKLS